MKFNVLADSDMKTFFPVCSKSLDEKQKDRFGRGDIFTVY